ncbi:MAG TPA: hypothetical protein VFA09_26690 [Ktedonobacteraceae bacterium]|nr:hypothetical protein [Ktedonobacteraceae bacterium]
MPNTSKHSPILAVLMKALLAIVMIAGIAACQQSPGMTSKKTSSSTSHIVMVDASLAHIYRSLKELKGDSTLIVLGTVNSQSTSIGNHGIPYTTSVLNIERTLLGKLTKKVLVRQIGGIMSDGASMEVEGFPLLHIGSRYFLFLTPSPITAQMYPVGAYQGVFVVDTNNQVSSINGQGLPIKDVPLNTFVQEVLSS